MVHRILLGPDLGRRLLEVLGHQDPIAALALLDRLSSSFRLGARWVGGVFLDHERSHEQGILRHDPLEALHVAQIMADSVLLDMGG